MVNLKGYERGCEASELGYLQGCVIYCISLGCEARELGYLQGFYILYFVVYFGHVEGRIDMGNAERGGRRGES